MQTDELALRQRLGVPLDAPWVIIFGESSHWDPNWIFTSRQYYRYRIRRIINEVLKALTREPRRVFSIESLYFLQQYWEQEPGRRDLIRQLVAEGRIKLTGSGITTPDTVLPPTEAILRDYLYGQQWLHDQHIPSTPRLAYLPDDFGLSPATPSILRALGFDRAGITRIDGMYFVGSDYRAKWSYPLTGSSAETLLRDKETLDFVWRAPDGSEVLCHWNAFTYFQGDMLAHHGIIRWMGLPLAIPSRTSQHVARRIQGFVRDLRPLARTPYLFCPIGCDFTSPIPGLVELLDRHNRMYYSSTGVWAVNAGMDDYLDLVACHKDSLPTLELDPNPYWMGFYASRPEAKSLCNHITQRLVLAEKLAMLHPEPTLDYHADMKEAWDIVTVSNHHDFITGTSSDRVWKGEQRPWLQRAKALAERALEGIKRAPDALLHHSHPEVEPPQWSLAHGRLEIRTDHYEMILSEALGGCLVSLKRNCDGEEMLTGPANDLVAYRDSGGLWRMGHEYRGGVFRETLASSRLPATIEAHEKGGLLEVKVHSRLKGKAFVRTLWFRRESPIIRMHIEGSAARRLTITCRWPMTLDIQELTMDVPGGVVKRPFSKLYDPTFWPARSFVHARDQATGWGLAAYLSGPACAAVSGLGAMEWVVLRNVPREMAFGVLPVLAHPVSGQDPDEHGFDYGVKLTPQGDYLENRLPHEARHVLLPGWFCPVEDHYSRLADSLVVSDREDVLITAIKAASRGQGVIVRLRGFASEGEVRLRCAVRPIKAAMLCNAREQDLSDLVVEAGMAVVPLAWAISSVRLLF